MAWSILVTVAFRVTGDVESIVLALFLVCGISCLSLVVQLMEAAYH